MKPFLGLNTNIKGASQAQNAEPFLIARAEDEQVKKLSDARNARNALLRKAEPSTLLMLGFCFFLLVAVLTVAGMFSPDMAKNELLERLFSAVFLGAIAAVFWVLIQRRKKKAISNPELQRKQQEIMQLYQEAAATLGVPETAASADILVFAYKTENGKICGAAPKGEEPVYKNQAMKLWCADGQLLAAGLLEKYAFPLESLQGIRTVHDHFLLQNWHKTEAVDAECYAPYELRKVDEGVRTETCYVLEFIHEGENWGIWFPNYELPVFEELTGLHASE